ncbi:MAG: hypothetical protein Q7J47_15340 [Azoarcus sp.]|nr:hypothetical protein [Azoarcus sp.]
MLEFLNLLFLGGVMLADITMYSKDMYVAKKGEDREQVTEVHLYREGWREEGKCDFSGLMVPYVRDWEEVDSNGVLVRPPEPDKTAGQAILINKKSCEGREPEVMLRSAQVWIIRQGVLMKKQMVQAADVITAPEDMRPKWLPQVLARIERVAEHESVAKDFIDSMDKLQAQIGNTPASDAEPNADSAAGAVEAGEAATD